MTTSTGDQSQGDSKKSKFGTTQWIATIFTLLVIVLVFAVVFPNMGDYSQAWTAIQGMSAGWIIALLILTVAVVVFYPVPLISALPKLAYRAAFAVRQTTFMIANVIPAGGAIGAGVQYGMLNTYGFPPARSADGVGITAVTNTLVTLALPIISLGGLLIVGEASSEALIIDIIGIALIALTIGSVVVVLRSEKRAREVGDWFGRLATRVMGWFHKSFTLDLGTDLVEFRASLVKVGMPTVWRVIGTTVILHLTKFMILFIAVVAIQGSGGSVNIAEAFAAYTVARLATFIPIPPGGLGTSDAIMTALLSNQFGMASSEAMAAVLIWRAATFFPQVLIGLGTLIWWRRKHARAAKASI